MSEDEDREPPRHLPPLPREVQEHLGRRLRTALHVEADKPAFLGETSVPPELEPLVRRLEASERGERQAYEAVKRALLSEDAPPKKPGAR